MSGSVLDFVFPATNTSAYWISSPYLKEIFFLFRFSISCGLADKSLAIAWYALSRFEGQYFKKISCSSYVHRSLGLYGDFSCRDKRLTPDIERGTLIFLWSGSSGLYSHLKIFKIIICLACVGSSRTGLFKLRYCKISFFVISRKGLLFRWSASHTRLFILPSFVYTFMFIWSSYAIK